MDPPPELQVALAAGVLIRESGRLLIGGTPPRLMRITTRAASMVASWQHGGPVGSGRQAATLARKLLDAGMLIPSPDPVERTKALDLAVVIPVHANDRDLDRCLTAIRIAAPGLSELVVVDDASPNPEAIAQIAQAHGALVVRHDENRGPAAARNSGTAATTAGLIAFVDSDVTVNSDCLLRLVALFADPMTAMAAPRVLSGTERDTWIAAYEARHSSLDLGTQHALVRPGSVVPYVPSATLIARREALAEGFDEKLIIGEDVDLVWRIAECDWNIWYDPDATVLHRHRDSFIRFAGRRFIYATSIGKLAKRHPRALPAIRVDWATLVVLLFGLGKRRTSSLAAVVLFLRIYRSLRRSTDDAARLATELTYWSLFGATSGMSYAIRRPWLPVVLALASRRRAPRAALIAAWAVHLRRQRPEHLADAALLLAEDFIAASGIWWSCFTECTLRPLVPARTRAPRAEFPERH
jgi:mycofactocin system glycosyltransferase